MNYTLQLDIFYSSVVTGLKKNEKCIGLFRSKNNGMGPERGVEEKWVLAAYERDFETACSLFPGMRLSRRWASSVAASNWRDP